MVTFLVRELIIPAILLLILFCPQSGNAQLSIIGVSDTTLTYCLTESEIETQFKSWYSSANITGNITGTPCDDGNPATLNDVIGSDGCTCLGTSSSGGERMIVSRPIKSSGRSAMMIEIHTSDTIPPSNCGGTIDVVFWAINTGCPTLRSLPIDTFTFTVLPPVTSCSNGNCCPTIENIYITPSQNPTICPGEPFNLGTVFITNSVNLNATTFHSGTPTTDANRINQIVTPTTTTTYYFKFLADGDCIVEEAFEVNVATCNQLCDSSEVTTVAGTLYTNMHQDGLQGSAGFTDLRGITTDADGNVYVADATTIRKMTPNGLVSTVAGQPYTPGFQDGIANNALFNDIQDLVVDQAGNIYVADYANWVIRKVTPAGVVSTLAGSPGTFGYADGLGSSAMFNGVTGLAIDAAGNIYASDLGAHTIRKITPLGLVTTIAGTAGFAGSLDGIGTASRFSGPGGIAVTNSGIIYVADRGNQTIRKIDPLGQVTTFAGASGVSGFVDGAGNIARFNFPERVAVDQVGNVLVADRNNSAIRIIAPNGEVSTLSGGISGYLDGPTAKAQFSNVVDVEADLQNNIYISDASNSVIRTIGCTSSSCEVEFTLERLPSGLFQVSLISDVTYTGIESTIASIQITVRAPSNFLTVGNLSSLVGGTTEFILSSVISPTETPEFDYFSFTINSSISSDIPFVKGAKVPLFTFDNQATCIGADSLYLVGPGGIPLTMLSNANVSSQLSTIGGGVDQPVCVSGGIELEAMADFHLMDSIHTICAGTTHDLDQVAISGTPTLTGKTWHTNTPATAANQLQDLSVTPTSNTTYYVLVEGDQICSEELAFTLMVEQCSFDMIISDPCSCGDPANKKDRFNKITHFHDVLSVNTGVANQTITLITNSGNVFLNTNLETVPNNSILGVTDNNGMLKVDFFKASGTSGNITIGNGLIDLPFDLSACHSNNCDEQVIPTMSQWGLWIFGLLVLNLGGYFIRREEGLLELLGK